MSAENKSTPASSFELSQAEIVKSLSTGVEQIRELSREQVDTWRRIPFWSLLSEGRSGYLGAHQRAYAHGLWMLSTPCNHHIADVDLATGEIVRPGNLELQASEHQILSLAPDHLDRLDASKILDRLVGYSREPVRPYATGTPESIAAWHREMMEKHGITEYYVRPAAVNNEEIRRQEDTALGSDLAPSA
jgi:hypothetical protein